MAKKSTDFYTPQPWPRGPAARVQRLYLNIAAKEASVYVHQKRWPRQPENPNWRIEVTDIDGRFAGDAHDQVFHACLDTARLVLGRWLAEVSPLRTIEEVTWPELVRLASQHRWSRPSAYQRRHNLAKARRPRERYTVQGASRAPVVEPLREVEID